MYRKGCLCLIDMNIQSITSKNAEGKYWLSDVFVVIAELLHIDLSVTFNIVTDNNLYILPCENECGVHFIQRYVIDIYG